MALKSKLEHKLRSQDRTPFGEYGFCDLVFCALREIIKQYTPFCRKNAHPTTFL